MTQTTPTAPSDETAFANDWREWRASREQHLRDPKGFLAITSLLWLGEEPISASDAPGAWTSIDDVVRVSSPRASGSTSTASRSPVSTSSP